MLSGPTNQLHSSMQADEEIKVELANYSRTQPRPSTMELERLLVLAMDNNNFSQTLLGVVVGNVLKNLLPSGVCNVVCPFCKTVSPTACPGDCRLLSFLVVLMFHWLCSFVAQACPLPVQ